MFRVTHVVVVAAAFFCALAGVALADPPVVPCGTILIKNGTWVESDLNDYYISVSAGSFTLVADHWSVTPSSPACNPSVSVFFAPDGPGQYAPQEHQFQDGESFNVTVGPVSPPVTEFDIFFNGGLCEYFIGMRRLEIVC